MSPGPRAAEKKLMGIGLLCPAPNSVVGFGVLHRHVDPRMRNDAETVRPLRLLRRHRHIRCMSPIVPHGRVYSIANMPAGPDTTPLPYHLLQRQLSHAHLLPNMAHLGNMGPPRNHARQG